MGMLQTVLAKAESDLGGSRYEEALKGFMVVVQSAPTFSRARLRIADTLLNLGQTKRATEVYRSLAWHFLKAGQPLFGLVASKMVIALDPAYEDLLEILAELYSSESDRTGDIDLAPAPVLDSEAKPGPPPLAKGDKLVEEAVKCATDVASISEMPAVLPPIPLFSHLGQDAFLHVLGSLRLKRFADGEAIIREGEPGDAFFMLADGIVAVTKQINGEERPLAHLAEGAVFGEMALVSNAPRTATVTARGEVALLSLSRGDLERHAGELDSITVALKKFTRGRFLANLAATSPLFADLAREERRSLLKSFQSQAVHAGDIMIEEGEAGRGLFLVLRGDFEVSRKMPDGQQRLAMLKSGDVFGEISLLREQPTNATVSAKSGGELLFLAREDFLKAIEAHPTLHATLRELTAERLRANRMFPAGAVIRDDASVMV
jgi:CRP-like cAMP-binding protein